jgi:hypothetical protein
MVRHTGENFIDVEGIAVAPMLFLQSAGINGSKLETPETDRFSGYGDTAFGEKVLDITVT